MCVDGKYCERVRVSTDASVDRAGLIYVLAKDDVDPEEPGRGKGYLKGGGLIARWWSIAAGGCLGGTGLIKRATGGGVL